MTNKAHNYKTRLLKNHSYDHEFEYNKLEFDEIDNRELRFLFTLPKTERNLELLEDVSEDNSSFSFGFVCGIERKQTSREKGIDYIRIIDSFQELREMSILDKFTAGAYPKAKGFKANDYQSGEKKAQKFVTKKNREALCEKHDIKLKELKRYIEKQKINSLFSYGSEFKIPLQRVLGIVVKLTILNTFLLKKLINKILNLLVVHEIKLFFNKKIRTNFNY